MARIIQKLATAIDVVEHLLTKNDARESKARILQAHALRIYISIRNAGCTGNRVPLLSESLQMEEEALRVFRDGRRTADTTGALMNLGIRWHLMWECRGYQSISEDFSQSLNARVEAYELLVNFGGTASQYNVCLGLVDLWTDACIHNQVEVAGVCMSPHREAIRWMEEANKLIAMERSDLSALGRLRAVLAKQFLTSSDMAQRLHAKAITFYSARGDWEGAWRWVQRSKARGVTEMLALGIKLPHDLSAHIESDQVAKTMVEKEATILAELRAASTEEVPSARLRLEGHREEMKGRPLVKRMFDLP